jgi:ABC-type lipoprotein export system ATPase subunit
MTAAPLIELRNVIKSYNGPTPLRVRRLVLRAGEQVALGGLDAGAAETLIHLVTGAALPEEGDVIVAATNTREIATDTAWLASLERFGIVTERAVFIEKLAVASNLALPLTVAIDPMPAEVERQVGQLADEVGLARERLRQPVTTLDAADRLRLHLARAIAPGPELLILEHPTATLPDTSASAAFGRVLQAVIARRKVAVLALTSDDAFARGSGVARYRLDAASGVVSPRRFWHRV